METSTKKRLSPTVTYLLTGMLMGLPALVAMGHLYPQWQSGFVGSPLSLAAIHTLILGSMLTIAFGVLFQIIPIAFQAPPNPRHVLYWHLPLHLLAVVIMVIGFLSIRFEWVGVGGVLLIAATIAYFSVILRSYRKARNKTVVHRGLVMPFAALFCVFLIGIIQSFWPTSIRPAMLANHALFGGLAFWVGLVFILSYKLVPMFVLSHGYKASLWRTAGFYFTGVLLFILSVWLPAPLLRYGEVIAALVVLAGILSFVVDMVAIVRAKKRRRVVIPMLDASLATLCVLIGLTWLLVGALLFNHKTIVEGSFILLVAGLVPLMFSYMQKMVPFLWFEYRYSKRPERKTAPLIDEMVSRRISQSGYILYYLGALMGIVLLCLPASSAASHGFEWTSSILLTVGSLNIFIALQAVLRIGGPRPADN